MGCVKKDDDDKAKIKEQAQRIQDLGDDLDNANELLTIAEEKVKEQAATIKRLWAVAIAIAIRTREWIAFAAGLYAKATAEEDALGEQT